MSNVKYTEDHEWMRMDDSGLVTIGITDFAQSQLGDLVYVSLPEKGKALKKGHEAVVIESVKAASGISMPIGGTVVEVNTALLDEPSKVNEDPMGGGWMITFKPDDVEALSNFMDQKSYEQFAGV